MCEVIIYPVKMQHERGKQSNRKKEACYCTQGKLSYVITRSDLEQ